MHARFPPPPPFGVPGLLPPIHSVKTASTGCDTTLLFQTGQDAYETLSEADSRRRYRPTVLPGDWLQARKKVFLGFVEIIARGVW